jgi:hypothetical protein
VHHHDELVVVRREQEPLRPPFDALEALAVERGDRRIERLQRGDVRRPGSLDRELLHEGVKLAAPRFDLGQLGQRKLLRRWTQSG